MFVVDCLARLDPRQRIRFWRAVKIARFRRAVNVFIFSPAKLCVYTLQPFYLIFFIAHDNNSKRRHLVEAVTKRTVAK